MERKKVKYETQALGLLLMLRHKVCLNFDDKRTAESAKRGGIEKLAPNEPSHFALFSPSLSLSLSLSPSLSLTHSLLLFLALCTQECKSKQKKEPTDQEEREEKSIQGLTVAKLHNWSFGPVARVDLNRSVLSICATLEQI